MSVTRGIGVAAVALSTVLLAACAGTSVPGQATPSATVVASDAPTPPAAPQAAGIVISTAAITVVDEAGATMSSYDYFEPTSDVVAGLTEVFGSAPKDTPFAGGGDQPPAIWHEWGGFRLVDDDYAGQAPLYPNHWVALTAASADGLQLSTLDGIAVGATTSEVAANHSDVLNPWTDSDGTAHTDLWIDYRPDPTEGATVDNPVMGVWISGPTDGAVTRIVAPSRNWGP